MRQLILKSCGFLFFIHIEGFCIYIGVLDISRLVKSLQEGVSVSHSFLWPAGFHAL